MRNDNPEGVKLSPVLTPQSSILNSQSSILGPHFSILNPQSSTLVHLCPPAPTCIHLHPLFFYFSVSYMISLKHFQHSNTNEKKTFSTLPRCTWLCRGLLWSDLVYLVFDCLQITINHRVVLNAQSFKCYGMVRVSLNASLLRAPFCGADK